LCLGGLSGIGRPRGARSGNENVSKEIAAMELDREVGIFKGMARQDQNDGIARFDESASAQLLESRQRVGNHGLDLLASKLLHATVERIRALRLNDGKLRQARDQFELTHFEKRLADRGTV